MYKLGFPSYSFDFFFQNIYFYNVHVSNVQKTLICKTDFRQVFYLYLLKFELHITTHIVG